ncbi:MAG: NAD-dependent epimerase/dehydratase family protein, partial [Myxococcota bacterium]
MAAPPPAGTAPGRLPIARLPCVSMETVLVTGGTGLIGKHLIERLLARGHRVLLLLRPGAETRRAEVLARLEAAAGASAGELH